MKNLNLLLITLLTATMAGLANDQKQAATGRTLEFTEITGPELDLEPELACANTASASAVFELGAPDRESVEARASKLSQALPTPSTAATFPSSRPTTPATSPFRTRSPLFHALMLKSEAKAAGLPPEFAKDLLKALE